MKKLFFIMLLGLAAYTTQAQPLAVKTNAVPWAFYGTPNLGVEVALFPRWTLDIQGMYNPWVFEDGKQSKFWSVQPELRHWFCRKFTGHFIGLHGGYTDYNFGMKKYLYEGYTTNLGLSYGYDWAIADSWRLEFNVGAGWLHKDYDKQSRDPYTNDNRYYASEVSDRIGLTRAGLSIVFLIH